MKYSNAEIITDIKRVFAANGDRPFTRRVYEDKGRISKTTVENRFGTWTDALKKAGIFGKVRTTRKVAAARK